MNRIKLDVALLCGEDYYILFARFPWRVKKSQRGDMAEYINRVNCDMMQGSFDMNLMDGEMHFRLPVLCEGMDALKAETVLDSLRLLAKQYTTYGQGLQAVLNGIKTPEDAYALVSASPADPTQPQRPPRRP